MFSSAKKREKNLFGQKKDKLFKDAFISACITVPEKTFNKQTIYRINLQWRPAEVVYSITTTTTHPHPTPSKGKERKRETH